MQLFAGLALLVGFCGRKGRYALILGRNVIVASSKPGNVARHHFALSYGTPKRVTLKKAASPAGRAGIFVTGKDAYVYRRPAKDTVLAKDAVRLAGDGQHIEVLVR